MFRALAITFLIAVMGPARAGIQTVDAVACKQSATISRYDLEVMAEVNHARQFPREYAGVIKTVFETMDALGVYKRGDRAVATGEGRNAVEEAVRFLLVAEPVPPLTMASCLNIAASRHAKAKGSIGSTGHVGVTGTTPSARASSLTSHPVACVENIGYGFADVTELVAGLIVDDSVPERGHRRNIFDPRMKSFGSGRAEHVLRKTIDVHLFCVEDIADRNE